MSHSIRSLLVMLLGAAPLLAADPQQPAADAPREVPLSNVITMLRKEAIDSWHKDRTWPRSDPSFAWEKKWTLPNEQLLTALARSLDRNPAIDAYIKWQLLGFQPDLSKADTNTINRIASSIPRPARQPEPSLDMTAAGGPQMSMFQTPQGSYVAGLETIAGNGVVVIKPKIRTYTSGASISTGPAQYDMGAIAVSMNDQLKESRKLVDQINVAVYTFRDALIANLPEEGGLRLAVMIKDVRDRVEVGDPRARDAMKKLIEAAPKLSPEPTITIDIRKKLVEWTWLLGTMKTPIVESVSFQNGQMVYNKVIVSIPREDITDLIALLQPPRRDPLAP